MGNLIWQRIGAVMALIAALVMAMPVLAAPKHKTSGDGAAHAHDGGKPAIGFTLEVRGLIEGYYREHGADCPPGLAKKRNGCLPPGQAKKRYRLGHALPDRVFTRPLPDDLLRHLPLPPVGHIYLEVDGDVLLVAEATKRIIDAVVILSGL